MNVAFQPLCTMNVTKKNSLVSSFNFENSPKIHNILKKDMHNIHIKIQNIILGHISYFAGST